MCFNSGAQAQLSAAQVASEQQRQAFEEALAFQKEQYQEAKTNRQPFLMYNQNAMDLWANLLGIGFQGGGSGGGSGGGGGTGGGGGGNGTIAGLGGTNSSNSSSSSSSSSSTGSGNRQGTSTSTTTNTTPPFDGTKFPGGPAPYKPGPPGKEHPLPGDQPILNDPNPTWDPNAPFDPDLPWIYPPGTRLNIDPIFLPKGPNPPK